MLYKDSIYGAVDIIEPIILDLIDSPTFQRLKHVHQSGYIPSEDRTKVTAPGFDHTRFAHSIGVYLLLYKFGAPLEEQIAGLLHDVSHSAFSHCADYALDSGSGAKQNHQDNSHDEYVKKSDLPKILKKYGYEVDYFLNDDNFPLKERDLPDLCADRIDYSLRDLIYLKAIKRTKSDYILSSLTVKDNLWVFKDHRSAKEYAELFYLLNNNYHSDFGSAVMFRTVGDVLKYSLRKRYITIDDLYTTDDEVLDKIKEHLLKDSKLSTYWERMNGKIVATNNLRATKIEVSCKSRVVDPLYLDGNSIKRYSDSTPKWGQILKSESKPKRYYIKFG